MEPTFNILEHFPYILMYLIGFLSCIPMCKFFRCPELGSAIFVSAFWPLAMLVFLAGILFDKTPTYLELEENRKKKKLEKERLASLAVDDLAKEYMK